MERAWIELDGEQAGWGPAQVVVAKLGRDGYVVHVLTGLRPKVLIISGRVLSGLGAAGHREPATRRAVSAVASGGIWPGVQAAPRSRPSAYVDTKTGVSIR